MDENYIINHIFIKLKNSEHFYMRIPLEDFLTEDEIDSGSPKIHKIINIIKKHPIFEANQNGSIGFSSSGLEISRKFNSWHDYLSFLEAEQIKENEAHEANIKSSEATVSAAKSAEGSYEEAIKSRNASYISVFFAGVAILISIIQPFENENETKEAYKELNERIDSLSKIQLKTQQVQKDSLIQNGHNAKSK